MHQSLETLYKSIEGLGAAIVAGKPDSNTMVASFGWNAPALTSAQFADQILKYLFVIYDCEIEELTAEQLQKLSLCNASILAFQSSTLPYLFNGNYAGVMPAYSMLTDHVGTTLESIFGWKSVPKANSIPSNIARKIEKLQAAVDTCIVDEKLLASKIRLIDEAHETAGELPLTLKQLTDAQKNIDRSVEKSSEYIGKIDTIHQSSQDLHATILEKSAEVDALAKSCSEAYRATTSVGLGAAFEARANKLANSKRFWVLALFAALVAGACVGYLRFDLLSKAMLSNKDEPTIIIVELIVSALSLGLPLWFAWIATKQIQENSKLSEDYAFKASVAKAYEGYRREAVRFNPEIEERLFAATLSRLEEQPLRYVDLTSHPTPYHESGVVKAATDTALEIKAIVVDGVKKKLGVGEN